MYKIRTEFICSILGINRIMLLIVKKKKKETRHDISVKCTDDTRPEYVFKKLTGNEKVKL